MRKILVATMMAAGVAHAATNYVSGGGGALQTAIENAVAGDVLMVEPGTYWPIATDNKAITIRGTGGPGATIIDGGGTNRCADMAGGVQPCTNTLLVGFTLQNGNDVLYGGGAYHGTLSDCVLRDNVAIGNGNGRGGGAAFSELSNCTLTGNKAGLGGGSHHGTLNGCTLSHNEANLGGGAYYGTLNECTLSNNFAITVVPMPGAGGGMYYGTMNHCTVTQNEGSTAGGIFGVTANHCTITGNKAHSDGGGAVISTLYNCVVAGNTASANSGGANDCLLNNCTVVGNRSGNNWGGGMYMGYVYNSIVWGNSPNNVGSTKGIANSLVDPDDDPMFVNAAGGDYRLQAGSPCIDAGDDQYVTWAFDLAGMARISGDRVDLGAYEFQAAVIANLTSLVITGITVGGISGEVRDILLAFDYEEALSVPVVARMWEALGVGAGSFPPCSVKDNEDGTALMTVKVPASATKAFFRIETEQ